jgi:hypothetical protein
MMKQTLKIVLTVLACNAVVYAQTKASAKHFFNSKHTSELRETEAVVYRAGKTVEYRWDSTNVSWIYNDSIRTMYNTMANSTGSITYYNISDMSRDTNIYNGSNLLTSRASLYWNGSSWDTSFIETFTYNLQNQQLTDQYYYYNGGVIAGGYLSTNTYNGNNQFITSVSQEYSNGTWVNSFKASLSYDGNGVPNKYIGYEWNGSNNTWKWTDSVINITFQYWGGNLDDSRIETTLTIDTTGKEVMDSTFYDTQNNQIKYIEYLHQGGNWVFLSKQTDDYVYDGNNNITQQIEMFYQEGTTTPTIANSGSKWVYSDFGSYTVSSTGIISYTNDKNVIVAPNPNNGTFRLSGELDSASKIEVYDILGTRLVSTGSMELGNLKEITLPNAAKGIYFVKILNKEKVSTTKILVD